MPNQTGFSCFRCKHWAARGPNNEKLDGDECTCQQPLHPAVIRARQIEAVVNAVIFGGVAVLVLPLLHISGPTFWSFVLAVVVVAYGFYSWLSGRKLRRERPRH